MYKAHVRRNRRKKRAPVKHNLGPLLSISIRAYRMRGLIQRIKPWTTIRVNGCVNGNFLTHYHRIHSNKCGLTKGQIGCAFSHIEAWKIIAQGKEDYVTIIEDDVDLHPEQHAHIIQRALDELKTTNTDWDMLSWGHGPHATGKNKPIQGLKYWRKPGVHQGLFMYTLKRSAAIKLLNICLPLTLAIDCWLYYRVKDLNILTLHPNLCYVIKGPSETTNILHY